MKHKAPKAFPSARVAAIGVAWLALVVSLGIQARPSAQQPAPPIKSASSHRQTLDRYCVTCHNQRLVTAGLKLDDADVANPGAGAELWEKVVRKLRTGMMPPPNMPQPSTEDRGALLSWLETSLDRAAAAKPNPGRTETLRRVNRTEYQNAIRDVLAVDVDRRQLPGHRAEAPVVLEAGRLDQPELELLQSEAEHDLLGERRVAGTVQGDHGGLERGARSPKGSVADVRRRVRTPG